MSRRPPTLAEITAQVNNFNARFAPGDAVSVRMDDGTARITRTRSEAQVLNGHSAVIWLDDVRGCYLLDRVSPIQGD